MTSVPKIEIRTAKRDDLEAIAELLRVELGSSRTVFRGLLRKR